MALLPVVALAESFANMRASRGMGAINPSKMPGKRVIKRKDNPDAIDMYASGGHVNAAGNYTKPSLRKRIVSQVKAAATQGTGAGQWSARKAQLVAKKYKAAGGGYRD
jgi:hypothetical protein